MEILAVEGSIPPSPTIVTLGGSFGHPSDVALDADGNVYVSDSQSGIVSKILAAGGYATDSPMAGGFGNPQGVAVAGNGTVLVSDTANNAVKEIRWRRRRRSSPRPCRICAPCRSARLGDDLRQRDQ